MLGTGEVEVKSVQEFRETIPAVSLWATLQLSYAYACVRGRVMLRAWAADGEEGLTPVLRGDCSVPEAPQTLWSTATPLTDREVAMYSSAHRHAPRLFGRRRFWKEFWVLKGQQRLSFFQLVSILHRYCDRHLVKQFVQADAFGFFGVFDRGIRG